MTFIKIIMSFLEKNDTIDKRMLFESPFTNINDQGLLAVLDDADVKPSPTLKPYPFFNEAHLCHKRALIHSIIRLSNN